MEAVGDEVAADVAATLDDATADDDAVVDAAVDADNAADVVVVAEADGVPDDVSADVLVAGALDALALVAGALAAVVLPAADVEPDAAPLVWLPQAASKELASMPPPAVTAVNSRRRRESIGIAGLSDDGRSCINGNLLFVNDDNRAHSAPGSGAPRPRTLARLVA